MRQKSHTRKTAQQGITLIEALISLLILALGVLGLAEVEARMLAETRTTNARATAIRLIADLGDRIDMNAAGARPAAAGGTSAYADSGTAPAFTTAAAALAAAAPSGCANPENGCTAQGLAAYDRWSWRRDVARALMNGQASISQVSSQQLQIIVAWQANENTNTTWGASDAANQVAAQLQLTNSSTGQPITQCSGTSGFICHVDFIDIPHN
jgi:type IV pilus assembly protein PilV